MIAAILSTLARLLGPILPFLATWVAAKRDARQTAKIRGLEADRKTRERMDNAEILDDPGLARRWLRERGEQ